MAVKSKMSDVYLRTMSIDFERDKKICGYNVLTESIQIKKGVFCAKAKDGTSVKVPLDNVSSWCEDSE